MATIQMSFCQETNTVFENLPIVSEYNQLVSLEQQLEKTRAEFLEEHEKKLKVFTDDHNARLLSNIKTINARISMLEVELAVAKATGKLQKADVASMNLANAKRDRDYCRHVFNNEYRIKMEEFAKEKEVLRKAEDAIEDLTVRIYAFRK